MQDREIVFDDFAEGQSFPPYDFTVTAQDRATFEDCVALGPLTRADGSVIEGVEPDVGGPLSALELNTFQVQRSAFRMPDGVLHAREKLTVHAPAYEGERLRMHIKVASTYRRNDRPFVVLALELERLDDGTRILEVERTLCWPR
jgi:hypothetical protein